MKKPKRKKSKFIFRTKAGRIIVQNDSNVWMRHVSIITYIQDFGYHNDNADVFTVFHLPTGLDIAYLDTEKEARILIKKLFVKIKKREWEIKTPDTFDLTLQLQDLALQITKTLKIKSLPFQNKKFIPNDDIPF
jgi:hypothetical protein